MKLWRKIRKYIICEEWNIAIRPIGETRLFQEGGTEASFKLIPNSFRYWCADPFIVSAEEKDYLFFEMFDRLKGKGVIGYRVISQNKIGKMKVAYEAPHHLSFPFIVKVGCDWYMMPEYSEGKEIPLLKATYFPERWEKVESWMNGKRCVDSALLTHQKQDYLFTQELTKGYRFDTLEIYVREKDAWNPHCKNPVVVSSATSRLAGRIFKDGETLIRVAQDCSEEYGKSLHFMKISNLDSAEYEEEAIMDVGVNDIEIDNGKRYAGVHTYNCSERYEVIDLKNFDHVSLGNVINLFWRIFKKVFP